MGHMGYTDFWYDAVPAALQSENIYLETSLIDIMNIQNAIEKVGAERILFGSDYPVLFHDGTPPFTSSLQMGYLAARYPSCTMILGYGGLNDLAVTAAQTAHRHENVLLQTCATTLLSLRRALELVGPDKILYGSDGRFADMQWANDKVAWASPALYQTTGESAHLERIGRCFDPIVEAQRDDAVWHWEAFLPNYDEQPRGMTIELALEFAFLSHEIVSEIDSR